MQLQLEKELHRHDVPAKGPLFTAAGISALDAVCPGKEGRKNKQIKTVFYI